MSLAPSGRRCFQLHLSTVLIMSLIAGVFLWVNVSIQYDVDYYQTLSAKVPVAVVGYRGWPLHFDVIVDQEAMRSGGDLYDAMPSFRRDLIYLATNVAVAASVLTVLTIWLEIAARKQVPRG